jgi:2-iminobutanoate/2-iminopropanoate deaminase
MPPLLFVPATSAADGGPGIGKQTALTLARLDERLRAERSSLADACAVTVYLRRASDFAAMNDEYRQAFRGTPPTRTTVVTEPLAAPDPGALVEMSVVAVHGGTDRRAVHPSTWTASPNPYSYAVRAGDLLFLSGLLSRNGRDNSVINGDVAVQTKAAIDNAKDLLDAAGLALSHIVSARVFLTDVADFQEMNRVYHEQFPDAPPARATVAASLTAPPYKVEMTFIASAGQRRAVDGDGATNPNLSAAIVTDDLVFASGILAPTYQLGDPAVETRAVLQRIESTLRAAGSSSAHVRDAIVYGSSPEAARAAAAICRNTFPHDAAVTPAHVTLVAEKATVEIMTIARRS